MTVLSNYRHFNGRHWETGSVCSHFAQRGYKAPHTGEPYSEALLMGVSGGAVMGYFSFAYEGYDPQARILTRNTFDPLDRMLERLGVVQNRIQTASPDKGRRNLIEQLESGLAPIVWADYFSLPYNAMPYNPGMWLMFPVVVFGYDQSAGEAWIADRARVGLKVSTRALDKARARVKKDKFRLLELSAPVPEKLSAAVQNGIWDSIRLYTEAPPRGSRNNFGFAAYQRWADLLVKPKQRMSWAKEFPPGEKMYAGLRSAFSDIRTFGKDGEAANAADRGMYADFLSEASQILDKPALNDAAGLFHQCASAWTQLSEALLPDSVASFGETRRLELRRHALFLDRGHEALDEIKAVDERLGQIKEQVAVDFPLDEAGVTAFRENLSQQILFIHNLEKQAVEALQDALN